MRKADLHTHTKLCNHATGEPEEYLRRAIELKFDFFGVSDHSPWPENYDSRFRMSAAHFPEYCDMVQKLKKLASGTGTEVLFGIETDFVFQRDEESFLTPGKADFDYVIGSVHYAESFAYDDPDLIDEWKKPGRAAEIWKIYLRDLLKYVDGGSFNIIAHPDLPKKFGYHPVEDKSFFDVWHQIFEIASRKGMVMELNAAGLAVPAKEIYPSPAILKIAKQHGMQITFGSDSHKPEQVGRFFTEAAELAKSVGFKAFSAFRKRESFELPFD